MVQLNDFPRAKYKIYLSSEHKFLVKEKGKCKKEVVKEKEIKFAKKAKKI